GGRTGQPHGLDRRDKGPGRRTEQGDVVTGGDPAGLKGSGHTAGLLVQLAPRDPIGGVRADKGDGVRATASSLLDARKKRGLRQGHKNSWTQSTAEWLHVFLHTREQCQFPPFPVALDVGK